MTGGLGDEAAKLVGRLLQGGLQSGFGSRPEVLRHLAAAAGSVAAALEALAAEAEQARSQQADSHRADSDQADPDRADEAQQPEGADDAPGTSGAAAGEQDVRVDVQKIDVTD